jgi:hypothetical protein
MNPLKRDHSRSLDLDRKESLKRSSATAAGLKNNKPSHLIQESASNSMSENHSPERDTQ